jgi:hypothetical protein
MIKGARAMDDVERRAEEMRQEHLERLVERKRRAWRIPEREEDRAPLQKQAITILRRDRRHDEQWQRYVEAMREKKA